LAKKHFFKSEMEISTFQDAGHNLIGAPDMAYSKFGPNYELWWTNSRSVYTERERDRGLAAFAKEWSK